ncbi:hypothetical protein EV363DRAFT_1295700 [Boletus edulis]|nr:hypothetical protein EV363DRAFT_1295700 [Boletus edulis]
MSDSECLYAETEYQESQYARSDEDSEAEIEGIAGEPDGELKSSEGPPGSPPGLPQAGSSKAELSKPSNPPQSGPGQGGRAKVPESALKILRERFPDWKNSDKEERKKHWRAITEAVRALPDHKTMSKQEWQASLRIYLAWMHQQGRAGREKKMKLGHQWTARSVVREEHKERLKEIILEKYGAAPGSVEMLGLYQTELNELIDELSEETWLEASRTAEEWNTQGPAPDVQARFATRKAQEFVKKFAVEMWKKGGIRMVILSGFKDEKGEIFAQVHDFNDEIADGPSFENAEEVQGSFDRYLSKCFDPPKDGDQGAEEDGDREKKQVGKPKKSQGRRRDDVVEKVLLPDGTVWIPEVQNLSRADLQDLVRGFLTAHYRIATRKPRVTAPFKKLGRLSATLFDDRHLPRKWNIPDDPSHLKRQEALHFLEFIRNRQALFPDDIFKFQCWLDRSEGPHPPATTDDDEEAPPTHSRSSRSRSKRQRSRSFGDRDTTDDGSEDAGEEVDELEENSKASDKLETEPEGGEGNGRRLDLHSDEREGNRRREPTPPPERRDLRAELDNVNDARTKYGPPRNVAKEKKGQLGEGSRQGRDPIPLPDRRDERAEQAHYAGIKYGPPRNIPKEKVRGTGREPTPPPDRHDLRAGLDHTDDAQIKYGPPRKVPKEKGQMGEGSRQGREPTPPPNHQDLRAELDNVDEARIKYGPPRKVPKEKGQLGEGSQQGREPAAPPERRDRRTELDQADDSGTKLSPPRKVPQEKGQLGKRSRGREPSPQPDQRDQGPYQEHAESGRVKCDPPKKGLRDGERGRSRREPTPGPDRRDRRADLDHAEDGPLQKVQKEEGPEAERSQQRREPKTACRGRDSRSEVDADDTRIKDKGHQGAGSRRAREASLDEGDCMEQSKDNRIKYSQLKKGLKTTGDEGEGSQEKRKPTPRPDQREKRAEPDHVEDACIKYGPPRKVVQEKGQEAEGSRQGRELSPRPVKWDGRAEINYPEDGRIKSGMPRKITKEKGQEGERHRQRRESTPGLDQVDARDERGYADDERGGQKKGPTSRLGHRQQEARVEKEHQTDIVKKGKGKEAEMSRQRLPADYARKDTTQGNMETIGDSSFDELPLFYADAGSASNKTIAKPVYQDDKAADLGRLPLKSAMKKPSHANNEDGNGEQGVIDYQIAEKSNIGREEPVGDSAETIRSKNSTQGHTSAVMGSADETAQITPRRSGRERRAPLPADAKYEMPEIPVGMKRRSDQQPATPRKKRRS